MTTKTEHFKNLNHCQQIEALNVLIKGFFVARFDNISNLDKSVAKMTAETFYEQVLKPRLENLKHTGQRMENGLTRRKKFMESVIVKGSKSSEEHYQIYKKNYV